MKHNLIPAAYRLYQTYKHYLLKGGGLILILGAGCYISYTAGQHSRIIPANITATPSNAAMKAVAAQATLDGSPSFAFPPYASDNQATPDNAELMGLDQLNLAYLYDDGADTSDPAYSYAGRLYSHLSELDAKWTASLNDLYNYTPQRLAAQMGLPVQTVTSGSEIIPEFTKVNLKFLNGDGIATSHTSNARDIIAMANTLYYYGVLSSMDEMEAYADKLWNDSHHYTLQMGDIYECDGSCLEERQPPAGSADNSQVQSQEAGTSSGPENSAGPGMAGESGEGRSQTGPGAETGDASTEGQTADAAPASGDAAADTPAEGRASDNTSASGGAAADTQPDADAAPSATDAENTASSAGTEVETGKTELSQKPYTEPVTISSSDPSTEHPAATSSGDKNTGGQTAADGTSAQAALSKQPASAPCPGHIDLTITIEVKGTSEKNGLFPADKEHLAGEAGKTEPEGKGAPGWQGWNANLMEAVRTITAQDWYGKYGINTADTFSRNPLTSEDINFYMAMIPENVSQKRKDFIRYALASVGKIPYYWGGKPSKPGYTGNDFGAIVSPDEDGRFMKGLDCSGWINWLYWSISGHGLGAESTGTLLSSGTATTKSQLIPGDICIRMGSMPHVVVFLGWADDGQMWCIQETSGTVNNVEVGLTTGDWQSYRRILD